MLKFEEKMSGIGCVENIWRLYSDVSQWKHWDKSVASVMIQGEFAENSNGIMTMLNGMQIPFVITECTANKSFSAEAKLGDICIIFVHKIERNENGLTICHQIIIDGQEQAKIAGMGKQIASGLSECLQTLLTLSNKL